MTNEKTVNALSGYVALLIIAVLIAIPIWNLVIAEPNWTLVLFLVAVIGLPGFMVVNPNESKVLVLFGAYRGTVKKNGFWWVNPFNVKKNRNLFKGGKVGIAYNVKGNMGLQLYLKNGAKILIGTQKPAGVERAMKKLMEEGGTGDG